MHASRTGFPLESVVGYFKAISDAVPLPIVSAGHAGDPDLRARDPRHCRACEHATYVKVESVPPATQVYRAVQAAGDVVEVFGGAGGGQFIPELRRGSIGTMPFPSSARAFVEVWDRWQAGDETGAQQIFDTQIAPLLQHSDRWASGAAHQVHKEALRRQGVIRTALRPSSDRSARPDDPRADLDAVCDQMGWNA